MKGIILAGGSGTRLSPVTRGVSKQLLPVYDKPMIYYPLTTLMLAGIRDILVITTPEDQPSFVKLLGDGSEWGISISYTVQPSPDGLAQAFILGRDFIGDDDVCLVLGDNIFFGYGFSGMLEEAVRAVESRRKAVVFGYYVSDPERYGVVEFDPEGQVLSIVEKPEKPKSNYAVVGRGFAWLDTGTHESFQDAGSFIQTVEKRQGLKIACPEEIAWRNGWIGDADLERLASPLLKNQYGQYLLKLLERRI